jgi:hypothetical protein
MKTRILCSGLCFAFLALCGNAKATSFTIGDINELGFVNPGIPASDANLATYVNALLGLAPGGSTTVTIGPKSNFITRSSNIFSPLDPAVYVSRTTFSDYAGPATIDINLGTGFEYLLVKYDGPNFGSEVWYVGGLSGLVTIPAYGSGSQYGISLAALFTPFTPPPPVPDRGTTLMLLASSLVGLGMLRRFVWRQAQAATR